jgi:hypothetical protein
VLTGGTGFVIPGATGGGLSTLAYGLTGSLYGVQNGVYSFNSAVAYAFTTTNITYVTTILGSSADAVTTVDFVHSSVTTDSFLMGLSFSTANQPLVVTITTTLCQVPALDSGHTITKGLVET